MAIRSNQTAFGARLSPPRVSSLSHCAGQVAGTSNRPDRFVQVFAAAPGALVGTETFSPPPVAQDRVQTSRAVGFPVSLLTAAVKR